FPFHRFRGCRRTRCAAGGPAAEKNAAFMRGDMQRWSELVRIAADFTLMQPFGGPPSRGFDMSPGRMAERARYFRNGKTDLELVQTYACEDIVVLVMIERQTAEVGGLPAQDWSLRVTEVYRKAGSEWNWCTATPIRWSGMLNLSRQPHSRVDWT